MKIELELYRPFELEAFGDFCKAVAAGQRQHDIDNPPANDYGLAGLIDRAAGQTWRTADGYSAQQGLSAGASAPGTDNLNDVDAINARIHGAAPALAWPGTGSDAPVRVPGQPSPGKQRRTKAEIAEDEAAAAAGNGNISTGGERTDPEHPDDAATEAQDQADEQAEVDEHRDADKPLTRDDIRAAMAAYVEKYGLAATQEDGAKIFVEALGNPPAGNDYWKVSLIPEDDQDKLAKVIATWKKAVELNPMKRAAV